MKYKVGDKVFVKSKKWFDEQPKNVDGNIDLDHIIFNYRMAVHCGQEYTVANKVYNETHYLLNGARAWEWSDEMLEDIKTIRKDKLNRIKNVKNDDLYRT